MKQYCIVILKTLLFWILFFAITRILFLLVYSSLLATIPAKEIFAVFYHAMRLDLATACYLISIPLLFYTLQLCFKHKIFTILLRTTTMIELAITSFIVIAETGVYGEWRSKLNYKALAYLRHPEEIIKTATTSQLIFSVVYFAVLICGFYLLYNRFVLKPSIVSVKKSFIKAPLCFIVTGFCCFWGMRGGFNAIPITQSASYFSHHNILNDAAVNPHWNIALNIADFGSLEKNNPFRFMDTQTAVETINELRKTIQDTTTVLLKRQDVNLVLILLESWSADLLEQFSGSNEIVPCFNALAKEGVLFTNFYANGHRSQQAICSILGGFPSVPNYDITDNHSKYKSLPSFIDKIAERGYHSSFYFGGNLDYGNIRAFLLHINFDKMTEEKNISKQIPRGKLGIHDQYMFEYQRNDLKDQEEPFFSMLFTLSSHSPYDQPKNTKELTWDTKEINYLNSAKYSDYWLGQYFEKVKKEHWYDNTLFILVADHNHPSHIERSYFSAENQRIPMLWFGNVLKDEYKGTVCNTIASQVDLPQTILAQLGFDTQSFTWGKNIFNPYSSEFAYFEINHGFGWITPHGCLTHLVNRNNYQETHFTGDSTQLKNMLFTGKAYVQKLFETYLEY
ncbi:MAG: sulfatase-like hydrolase/transferase [Bacteroidales bacterium]|nr:sulfatase-like hydrolase/transferase [Bacteroidales bacterium]